MTAQGKVVKIIDEYSVVVDIGYSDGVNEDMEFVIYNEGETIEDPDSGEKIGTMEHRKAKVSPHHIMENMTVMESSETEIETFDVGPSISLPSINKKKKVEVKKELPLDEIPDKPKEDNTIEVGDLIREYQPEIDPYGTK